MKNMIFCLSLSLLFVSFTGTAQSGNDAAFRAFVNNDLTSWENIVNGLARQQEQVADPVLLLQMSKAAYGATLSCFAQQDMDLAADWVDRAEEYAEDYLDVHPKSAEGKAILAGIYGLKIGLKPIRGMKLGPKSGQLLSEAIALDENCALAYFVMGSSAYNTPATWGGSVEKAATYFATAKELYEQQNATTTNWEYLNTLVWLGQSQHQLQRYEPAQTTYLAALNVAPEYGWVKYQLLPATEKMLGNDR